MQRFEIQRIAKILGSDINAQGIVTGVSINSREIKAGDCFVAIKGANHDGHDFVEQAIKDGAVCAIVSKEFKSKSPVSAPLIAVEDTIVALGQLAKSYRNMLKCKIIGITGSAGKTTTRQIAFHVLDKHFKCHVAQKSFNNNIGLPLTILGIKADDEIAILELGTNHPGEIEYLTRISEPDLAVITNAYDAHIENFGSVAAIIKEKTSIAMGLKAGGRLIINQDCEGLEEFVSGQKYNYVTFGKTGKAQYRASDIELEAFSSRFRAEGVEIEIPLPGKGNIDNAMAAYAVCRQFGVKPEEFAADVKDLAGVAMRLEPLQVGKMTIISDCYNANPASMKNAIEVLSNAGKGQGRRLVFICGQMLELGEHSERLHSELGVRAAEAGLGLLAAVGPFAKIVAESAKKSTKRTGEIYCFDDTKSLCNNLSSLLRPDDIILVKGSRGARLETVVDRIKEVFSNCTNAV